MNFRVYKKGATVEFGESVKTFYAATHVEQRYYSTDSWLDGKAEMKSSPQMSIRLDTTVYLSRYPNVLGTPKNPLYKRKIAMYDSCYQLLLEEIQSVYGIVKLTRNKNGSGMFYRDKHQNILQGPTDLEDEGKMGKPIVD